MIEEYRPAYTAREAFIAARANTLRGTGADLVMDIADKVGVQYRQNTKMEDLYQWIANAEWKARPGKEDSPYAMEAVGEYPPAEVTGVPFEDSPTRCSEAWEQADEFPQFDLEWSKAAEHAARGYLEDRYGKEHVAKVGRFENMDSGPMMEEPDPAVTKLHHQIMERWIGAVGGMDWYNGPTKQAARAQSHGKALAAVLDDVVHGGVVRGSNPYQIKTSSGWFIYEVVLPQVLEHFFRKNADYGDNHREGLGVRAEFVGIHRKIKKLRKAVWDGEELAGEPVEEILTDLIGQCLIMLDLLTVDHSNHEDAEL